MAANAWLEIAPARPAGSALYGRAAPARIGVIARDPQVPHGAVGPGVLFPEAPLVFSRNGYRSPERSRKPPRDPKWRLAVRADPSLAAPVKPGSPRAAYVRAPASARVVAGAPARAGVGVHVKEAPPQQRAPRPISVSAAFRTLSPQAKDGRWSPGPSASVTRKSVPCPSRLVRVDVRGSRASVVSATMRQYRHSERGFDAARKRSAVSARERAKAELRRVQGMRRSHEAAAQTSIEVHHALIASAKRRAADDRALANVAPAPTVRPHPRPATAAEASAAARRRRATQSDSDALRALQSRWSSLSGGAPRARAADRERAQRAALLEHGAALPPKAFKGYAPGRQTFLPQWERKKLAPR